MMVEDYMYADTNFRDERGILLPKGEQWDDRGKNNIIPSCFCFILYLIFFCVLVILRQNVLFCRHWSIQTCRSFAYREARDG